MIDQQDRTAWRWLPWIGLVMIAGCSVTFTILVVTADYWIDDSFIGFRYARNLSDGFGLVFNPGERIEGYTSFLWVMISFLGVKSGSPMLFLQSVSVAAQVITLLLVFQLGLRADRSRLWALIGPFLLACHVTFLIYPMTGMDTMFFTMLITLAVLLFTRDYHKSTAGSWLVGLVLLAIALTRFDGLVIVAIILSYRVFIEREFRSLLIPISIFLVGVGLYNTWRLGYYPSLLPNTFYAKVRLLDLQFFGGVRYLINFFLKGWPFLIPVALIPFVLKRTSATVRFAGWVASGHLVYVFYVGGDWMPYFRFILPVLPLLFFLSQEAVWVAHQRFAPALRQARLKAAVPIALTSIMLIINLIAIHRAGDFTRFRGDKVFNAQEGRLLGEHLSRTLPADYVVAIEWAGIVPYYLQQPVLDIFGLNDHDITTRDFPASRMGRAITVDYLLGRNPEAVVVCVKTFPTWQKAEEGVQLRVKQATEGNWMRDFYATLANPQFGYKVCVMKIDEHNFYPVLLRNDLPIIDDICNGSKPLSGRAEEPARG